MKQDYSKTPENQDSDTVLLILRLEYSIKVLMIPNYQFFLVIENIIF